MSTRNLDDAAGGSAASNKLNMHVAHSARMYDYYLGGKDNFAADREAAEKVLANFPAMRTTALENRAFLRRVVTHLAGEAGIRQFLDIGTGIPAVDNTHEVAQRVAPGSRVVYADNDPIVLAHARALLTGDSTAYLHADLRDPDGILAHARTELDWESPVALLLVSVLQFLTDDDDPYAIVARMLSALPAGSHLVISHATGDFLPPSTGRTGERIYDAAGIPLQLRTREEISGFFDGCEVISPGLVPISEWRAETEPQPRPALAEAALYGAVARVI
ncbi:SAM-dependent methyltransferase [Actinomadura alba]|uniref:SAM-dependent methyltransferase n=1 Tax=Actinomadura alba TaxID=406431 RepID=A0ABR7LNE2_9ACTN|nr:SAM-dependent methyltransferase [Actinomadura alba]MBC6466271.1 SAM-dependent methyltransferase [Actinomadura alba]